MTQKISKVKDEGDRRNGKERGRRVRGANTRTTNSACVNTGRLAFKRAQLRFSQCPAQRPKSAAEGEQKQILFYDWLGTHILEQQ